MSGSPFPPDEPMSTPPFDSPEAVHVRTIAVDQRRYDVSVEISHDGIEYLGLLLFTDEAWPEDAGAHDHAALRGRRSDDVIAYARSLTDSELIQRYRRAVADARRFLGLRRLTDDVLTGIRHPNRVSTSMRAGLLDLEQAAEEIESTERELHTLIDRLRTVAGVEG